MDKPAFRITVLHRLAGIVGAAFLHLVGRTSMVAGHNDPAFLSYRRLKKPIIYAFWHNNQAFLAWTHRGEPVHTIVSKSKDGEYIAQVLNHLDLRAVRGSSSRGAEAAFRELLSVLERGEQVGFTPDGPRGPVQRVHGGVVAAAQMSGAPIVPAALDARRKIVFRSWDRFFIPLPLTHIAVVHGRPFWVEKDEDPIAAAERVRQALNAVAARAEAAVRTAPSLLSSFVGWMLGKLYSLLAAIIGPLSLFVFVWRHGAERTFKNLGERLNPGGVRSEDGLRLWLHAASVGEWQALRPVLHELESGGEFSFVITVSSPEARAVVSREVPTLPVRMLPLDMPAVIADWIDKTRPDAAIVVETEIWPNLIGGLKKALIPVFVINGRLSERSARHWKLFRPFSQRLLSSISHFFVRTDLDGQRFCSIGAPVPRVSVIGNTKIDNLTVLSVTDRAVRRARMFGPVPPEDVILVAGSTWPGEEEMFIQLLHKRGDRRLRIVLAPRRVKRFAEVARMLDGIPFSWSTWTKAKSQGRWDTDILLVDTLGDLKDLYGAGDIAFVGGSLVPRGGQNPLEPAAAGIPILFGSSMENFHEEADDLQKAGGARRLRHVEDLVADVAELSADSVLRASTGEAAARLVRSKQGAARRTADHLRAALLVKTSRG